RLLGRGHVDRGLAILGGQHAKARAVQVGPHEALNQGVVVGYQHSLAFAHWLTPELAEMGSSSALARVKAGNVNVKVVPTPTSLSTEMAPPCDSTRFLQMNRPRPAPLMPAPEPSTR